MCVCVCLYRPVSWTRLSTFYIMLTPIGKGLHPTILPPGMSKL